MKKIDFLVVGVQKAGTSALDAYLRRHPEIRMPEKKELHFFDNETVFSNPPVNYAEFENKFDRHEGTSICGEATPIYMYWEPGMKRIWEYNPEIRLIAILRNPIDRAFSHWNMEMNRRAENMDFFYCITHEKERCLASFPLQHRIYSYTGRGFYSNRSIEFSCTSQKTRCFLLNTRILSLIKKIIWTAFSIF